MQEEILRWIFSITGAVLIYLVVAMVITSLYHPDIGLLVGIARKMVVYPEQARPEPMEALLFRAGTRVTIIGGIIFFYTLFSKIEVVKKLTW